VRVVGREAARLPLFFAMQTADAGRGPVHTRITKFAVWLGFGGLLTAIPLLLALPDFLAEFDILKNVLVLPVAEPLEVVSKDPFAPTRVDLTVRNYSSRTIRLADSPQRKCKQPLAVRLSPTRLAPGESARATVLVPPVSGGQKEYFSVIGIRPEGAGVVFRKRIELRARPDMERALFARLVSLEQGEDVCRVEVNVWAGLPGGTDWTDVPVERGWGEEKFLTPDPDWQIHGGVDRRACALSWWISRSNDRPAPGFLRGMWVRIPGTDHACEVALAALRFSR